MALAAKAEIIRDVSDVGCGLLQHAQSAFYPAAKDKLVLAKMTADTAITAKLTVDGEPRLLPQEWENNLLRIGQEVLTNALRHSQASEFCGRLSFGGREVSLHLRDNGIGFDPEGQHEGFGLQGIRERAETMAGTLAIQSEKGRGVSVSIVLPVDPRVQL